MPCNAHCTWAASVEPSTATNGNSTETAAWLLISFATTCYLQQNLSRAPASCTPAVTCTSRQSKNRTLQQLVLGPRDRASCHTCTGAGREADVSPTRICPVHFPPAAQESMVGRCRSAWLQLPTAHIISDRLERMEAFTP